MSKLEQAARQALEALIKANHFHDYEDEITALREALAGDNMSPTEQAEQEPVAWMFEFPDKRLSPKFDDCPHGGKWKPLYASPVRTKDLTDDEIDSIDLFDTDEKGIRELVRNAIDKYKRKNNA